MFRNLNPVHTAGAILIGCIVGSFALLFLYGEGHNWANDEPTGVHLASVCPSARWAMDDTADAALWWDALGRPIAVRMDDCTHGPELGELQIRGDGDAVEGWGVYLQEGEFDLVGVRDGRAVAYVVRFDRRPCTIKHVLGHALGVGHTSAATSVMHPRCGETDSYIPVRAREPGQ